MSRMNLLTESESLIHQHRPCKRRFLTDRLVDYQPVINVDDADGDTDDEEMLEMGVTPLQ